MINRSLFTLIILILINSNIICYNLESLCKIAINNDLSLLSTYDQQSSDREQSFHFLSTLLPTLTTSIAFNTNNLNNSYLFENKSIKYQITFNHNIFNLNNYHAYQLEKIKSEISKITIKLLKENIILKTIDQYLSILLSKHELKTMRAKMKIFTVQLKVIKKLYKNNLVSIYVVRNIKEKIHLTYIKEVITTTGLISEYDKLREICNTKINKISDMKCKTFIIYPKRLNYDHLYNTMIKKNQNLHFIKSNLNMVKYKIEKEKFRYFPTIVLHATYIRSHQKTKKSRTKVATNKNISITIQLPVFHNSFVYDKFDLFTHEYNSIEKNYKKQLIQNENSLKNIYRTLMALSTKKRNIEQAMVSHQVSLKLAELRYKYQGRNKKKKDITEVLSAYYDVINMEKTFRNVNYKYISEMIRLKKILGELQIDNF